MATQERRTSAAVQTGLYVLIVAVIAVFANILSTGWYKRVDLTANQRYTLSAGTGRLLGTLKEPMKVDLYVTTGQPQLNQMVRDLTDLMLEYERAGKGKFQFRVLDTSRDDELKKQAEKEGLQKMAFGALANEETDAINISQGFLGLVLSYGAHKDKIPAIDPDPSRASGLEFWITNKIREIRDQADGIEHKVGVISGKDDMGLSDTNLLPRQGGGSTSIQDILTSRFPFYKVEKVELSEDEEIDGSLDGVIITQPRKPYTEKELRRIDQFMMRGNKSLVVIAGAYTARPNDAKMEGELTWNGLEQLLVGYGFDVQKDVVYDFGAQMDLQVMSPVTRQPVGIVQHPGVVFLADDPRFAKEERLVDIEFVPFFRTPGLVFPFPSTIKLLPERQPGATLSAVARTTEAASVKTGDKLSVFPERAPAPQPPFEQRIIAAAAVGQLKAAFGPSEDVPRNDMIPAGAEGRVLVIASGQFVTNPFCYAGNGPEMGGQFAMMGAIGGDEELQMVCGSYAPRYLPNTLFALKNTLDWMSGDADLVATSSKMMQAQPLTYSSISKPKVDPTDSPEEVERKAKGYKEARVTTQRTIQTVLAGGLPLLFVLVGLARWVLRDRRRRTLTV